MSQARAVQKWETKPRDPRVRPKDRLWTQVTLRNFFPVWEECPQCSMNAGCLMSYSPTLVNLNNSTHAVASLPGSSVFPRFQHNGLSRWCRVPWIPISKRHVFSHVYSFLTLSRWLRQEPRAASSMAAPCAMAAMALILMWLPMGCADGPLITTTTAGADRSADISRHCPWFYRILPDLIHLWLVSLQSLDILRRTGVGQSMFSSADNQHFRRCSSNAIWL